MKIKIAEKIQLVRTLQKMHNCTLKEAQQIYADMPQKERKRIIRGKK